MEAWLENNDRHEMIFPPQSPDVNPNKNIWSWVKKDKDFKAALFRKFDRICPAKTRTLYSSLNIKCDTNYFSHSINNIYSSTFRKEMKLSIRV